MESNNYADNQKGFLSNILGILILAVIASVIAFNLGMRYEKSKPQEINKLSSAKVTTQETPIKEDLEERCGKLPSDAYPKGSGGLSEIEGPFWSPDCRYAVSSLSIVGIGLGPDFSPNDVKTFVENLPKGVYLYNDASKTLTKVYRDGTVEEWKDRENFTFTSEGKKYNYNVTDKKFSS